MKRIQHQTYVHTKWTEIQLFMKQELWPNYPDSDSWQHCLALHTDNIEKLAICDKTLFLSKVHSRPRIG